MKLRNKKNGIVEQCHINCGYAEDRINFRCYAGATYGNAQPKTYNSLAELNAEWEDYEEPKKYWRITDLGELKSIRLDQHHQNIEKCKEIGNYFETKEEAEKAVEKLKAWKRLKDKGFRFNGGDDACISYRLDTAKWNDKLDNDFDLLFGGEE